MKRLLPGLLLLAAIAAPASAQELYVVHGIDGSDLGFPSSLPVDVSVGGDCLLTDLAFGDIEGPVPVEVGRYTVEIRLAAGAGPCGGTLVLTDEFSLSLGESSAIVAHLTAEAVIAATKFRNDVRVASTEAGFFGGVVNEGDTRVIVRHAAAAPPVDVFAQQAPAPPLRLFSELASQEQRMAVIPAESTSVAVAVTGTRDLIFGPITTTPTGASNTIFYAVGSLENGTFTLLAQSVPLR